MNVVKNNGDVLRFILNKEDFTEELCFETVKQCSHALTYVTKRYCTG